jgi:glycosyltransferase involved in cell wall biosynthesis
MNVLSIYPGMNERCDNSHMLTHLLGKGVKMSVIACRDMAYKGAGTLPACENMAGIPIHRLFDTHMDMFAFPRSRIEQCRKIAADLKPDLIFCSQELNMRLALVLQKTLRVPIVLLVEDAGRIDSGEAYRNTKFSFAMNFFGVPSGPRLWGWLSKRADALITCHPKDSNELSVLARFGKPVYFLPWPTYVPSEFTFPLQKVTHRGIYVGSLSPSKNTHVFERLLPRILRETPTEEFLVIGPGPHVKTIEKLQKETNGAVKHLLGVSRLEALQLMASSFYAYTPVLRGGWGFIGDCWSTKAPLVMTHNDEYVVDGQNALVADSEDDLIADINRLYSEPELYVKLQQNGLAESCKKDAAVVGDQLYDIFIKTLNGRTEKDGFTFEEKYLDA